MINACDFAFPHGASGLYVQSGKQSSAGNDKDFVVIDDGSCADIVDFGGGIRSEEALESALSAGADKVDIGSVAAKDRESVKAWGRKHPGRIILSADARDGMIAISGWQEETSISLLPFLSDYLSSGIDTAVVTDIAMDGMLSGPSIGLYRTILSSLPGLFLIASGGVSSAEDLHALAVAGCYGAIVGKAYYEGRISISVMKEAECLRRG